ncbi:sigma-70 family RNA polymerase sigma factor [Streptacidiphilus sp. PB12-B1b]|nr:sigma-70 family RNA polymerase sigma factor [Streptacidiphilus sp. PB12-B1b]
MAERPLIANSPLSPARALGQPVQRIQPGLRVVDRPRREAAPRPTGRVDDAAMRALYRDHRTPLLNFVMSLVHDRQRAEDVVQETFLRLWRHPEALIDQERSIRPWLFTVARRIVIDAKRAQSVRPVETDDSDLAYRGCDDDAIDRVTTRTAFVEALNSLSACHRAVLVELYYLGCSVAETADRLGIPQGTVKSRSHYALRQLRESLLRRGVLA